MGILCDWFGHKSSQIHGKTFQTAIDGVGTYHYELDKKCDRCGTAFTVGRFHAQCNIKKRGVGVLGLHLQNAKFNASNLKFIMEPTHGKRMSSGMIIQLSDLASQKSAQFVLTRVHSGSFEAFKRLGYSNKANTFVQGGFPTKTETSYEVYQVTMIPEDLHVHAY